MHRADYPDAQVAELVDQFKKNPQLADWASDDAWDPDLSVRENARRVAEPGLRDELERMRSAHDDALQYVAQLRQSVDRRIDDLRTAEAKPLKVLEVEQVDEDADQDE